MGKNCADRRRSSEWDSFIATQAYSALCKSKTMKEVKSGERQKHWQMRRMILSDINMRLNHITEGLEYKHTYAVSSLAAAALSTSLSPLFYLPTLFSLPIAWLGPSLLFSSILQPCSSLACLAAIQSHSAFQRIWHSEVIVCERWFSSPLTLSAHANYHSPTVMLPNLPALTAYDTLSHELEEMVCFLCFSERLDLL